MKRSVAQDNRTLRERALAEHQRILAALQDRDGELAELLMRRHIASVRVRRMQALGADAKEFLLDSSDNLSMQKTKSA